jgi:hypothetical protein
MVSSMPGVSMILRNILISTAVTKLSPISGMEWQMFIKHSIISYKSTNSWHGVQKWIVPSNENSNWINVFPKLWKRIIYNIYKKNFKTLELTLGTEVNSIVHCC